MSESHQHPPQQPQQQPLSSIGAANLASPGAGEGSGSAGSGAGASTSYKRASRKGAPRRYGCQFSGCDKVYSRQEHLQRHQLNRRS